MSPTSARSRYLTSLPSREAFETLHTGDVIFGCLDIDGARLVLNEFALSYRKSLFVPASDIEVDTDRHYGERIAVIGPQPGCLVCMELLDIAQAQRHLEWEATRRDRARIYGVDMTDLDQVGPLVVPLNGFAVPLAVIEFMTAVTGVPSPKQATTYRGDQGVVTVDR